MSTSLEDLLRDAKIELVIARFEQEPSIIKDLIELLNNDIRSIRFNATLVLGEIGADSADAVSELVDCLEDEDWSICRESQI
jgi:HEAT repeat protein